MKTQVRLISGGNTYCYYLVVLCSAYSYPVTFRPTVLLFQNNRPVNSHVSHRLEQTEPRRSEEEEEEEEEEEI